MKQQSAVTTQSVRHNFADSLSQYSKMSDELAGGSEILQDKAVEMKSKVTSTIYNGKKTGTNFATDKNMGKTTTKKLPDLHQTYNSATGETMGAGKAGRTVGQNSDSEPENSAYTGQAHPIKMPPLKAGSQLSDIYQQHQNPKQKGSDITKKQQQLHGSNLNNGVVKYLNNQTTSPSQTFFKGKMSKLMCRVKQETEWTGKENSSVCRRSK